MNWITNVVRPKINSILRREMPDNKWVKDPDSGQMVYHRDLEANQFVMPGSGYHMRMASDLRLKSLFDEGEYQTIKLPAVAQDPLQRVVQQPIAGVHHWASLLSTQARSRFRARTRIDLTPASLSSRRVAMAVRRWLEA